MSIIRAIASHLGALFQDEVDDVLGYESIIVSHSGNEFLVSIGPGNELDIRLRGPADTPSEERQMSMVSVLRGDLANPEFGKELVCLRLGAIRYHEFWVPHMGNEL